MHKVDLHTHSIASHDGGITPAQYAHAISTGILDAIAVTDHNSVELALILRKELGPKIIVGEEIMTNSGEIIGLFLKERIKPGLTPLTTIRKIREQEGIVYIPHPLETFRKGLPLSVLEEIFDQIDIIEAFNGRAFLQNKHAQSAMFAKLNNIRIAASSDAHGAAALGKTYTLTKQIPSKRSLLKDIETGTPIASRPSLQDLLFPKYNKLKKKLLK
jgi:predicted metal-dependent phosphoesterase TrpH